MTTGPRVHRVQTRTLGSVSRATSLESAQSTSVTSGARRRCGVTQSGDADVVDGAQSYVDRERMRSASDALTEPNDVRSMQPSRVSRKATSRHSASSIPHDLVPWLEKGGNFCPAESRCQ